MSYNQEYNNGYHINQNTSNPPTTRAYSQTPIQSPLMPVATPPRRKKSGGKVFGLLLACTVLGLGAGVGGAYLYDQVTTVAPQVLYTSPPLEAQKVVTYSSKDVALPDLYAMNVNSSVGITVSSTVNVFGQPTTSAAAGSGFVITEDGYVVTNHHVIEDAIDSKDTPIEVKFVNGDSYTATIVGYEKENDLAVLKINATGLQPVVFGDSDALVVGETVVAIGNPLGELDFSFTDGIVSAKDRLISTGDGVTMNMLQTNTAINPGNSGGPLFDGQGALIGINTAKYATSSNGTTVEGLGFAIPINDVKDMILDIMENGYVTGKPYLGVTVGNVPDEAQQYGITAGAAILGVANGSAAERAGLTPGDIVTAIDDVTVDTYSALTAAMVNYKAGDKAIFTVVRQVSNMQFETLTVQVTFDEKNDATTAANNNLEEAEENYNNFYGGYSGNDSGSSSNTPGSNNPFDRFLP